MVGRTICAIGFLLACGAVCGAQQTAGPAVATQQARPLLAPINSPEIDALAKSILEKVRAGKATSIVLVGGGTSEFKVSELGVSLREGLNEALLRQAAGVRVFTTADVSDVLKRNRVSESMVYCNPLADWIAAYAHADAAVILQMDGVKNGGNLISVEMFDERKPKTIDKKKKIAIPDARFESSLVLTNEQAVLAGHEYHAPTDTSIPEGGKNGIEMPMCVYCPKPDYTEEGRQARFFGTVYLEAVVRPDGKADDIRVTRPVGHGLDGTAVSALLGWQFGPRADSEGHPLATRVSFQMMFQLY